MRIQGSEECGFCQEQDNIIYYLYECTLAQQFWRKATKWFNNLTHSSLLDISRSQFVFGVPQTRTNWKIINWTLLVGKFFIQRQKLFHKEELHLIHFLAFMKDKLTVKRKVCSLERGTERNIGNIYIQLSTRMTP